MPRIPNRWAVFRIRFSGPFLLLKYWDSLGQSRRFSWDWRLLPPPILLPADPQFLSELGGLAKDLVQGLPDWRPGPHNTGPVPLAVFFSPPSGPEDPKLDEQFSSMISLLFDPNRVQIVRLSRAKPVHRSPFRLPFQILAFGDEASLALVELQGSSWYLASAETQEFGLQIEVTQDAPEMALRTTTRDIVITGSASPLLEIVRSLPERRRPRLVIFLDNTFLLPADLNLPSGVALLRLPHATFGISVAQFLRTFVYGLIHDLPLHEAIKSAIRTVEPIFSPLLIADPISNQSLRIMEALTQIKRQSDRWETTLPIVDFEPLFDRLKESKDPALKILLPSLRKRLLSFGSSVQAKPLSDMRAWTASVRSLPVDFTNFEMETEGLVPMASMEANSARLRKLEPIVRRKLQRLTKDQVLAKFLREHQKRSVDVALERMETDPFLEPVSCFNTLERGAVYQLRVHIGNRLSDSIVVGPPARIDPLLPDPDDARGHLLEITIQGKDYRVLSDSTQAVWLPQFGGSEPAYFRIRAPEALGQAELRICIYHRNHIIQTYLLNAKITTSEQLNKETNTQSLCVRLEFSRTEKFTDLDEHQPRFLSVGANLSGASSTHGLIVKGEQASGEFTLFPATYEPEVQKFRKTLEAAVKDPTNPKLPRVYPVVPAGQSPAKEVADIFRNLARQGSDLYDAVFGKAARTDLRKALVRVKQTSDQKLQVVRFDDNFVFPWALLYDFPLPDEVFGQDSPPMCLGVSMDANGNTVTCSHSYKDKVFCTNGFWGVRHYVEELIGQGANTDAKVSRPSNDAIRIVADASLPSATTLVQHLGISIGAAQIATGPADPDQLLDLLWTDPPQRPSILIVLGHLETDPVPGQPNAPRVVLVPQSKWLVRKKISERAAQESSGWSQPRSVVLMMVCESAATDVKTVNDFVTAWNTAGAGAIIGTESIVGSGLAAELAEEVTKALWNQKTLGEAMTGFRRRAVRQGNPVALVFHAIGDVDLTVQ